MQQHHYELQLTWRGNTGKGTTSYTSYERSYEISIPGKPVLQGTADPMFRGNPAIYNPEDMLVAALSACHMLWYLHLCAVNNVIVIDYIDYAEGEMQLDDSGLGKFTEVTLKPVVTVSDKSMIPTAIELHKTANASCFIANSVNFPVHHQPQINA